MEKFLLGLGVGILFGYILQRGRFCMYTAFRDILLIKDLTLFKAYLLALTIQVVLIHLFEELGWLSEQVDQNHLDSQGQEIGLKEGEIFDQQDIAEGRVHAETASLKDKSEEDTDAQA